MKVDRELLKRITRMKLAAYERERAEIQAEHDRLVKDMKTQQKEKEHEPVVIKVDGKDFSFRHMTMDDYRFMNAKDITHRVKVV